jgi:hypothetical protein
MARLALLTIALYPRPEGRGITTGSVKLQYNRLAVFIAEIQASYDMAD